MTDSRERGSVPADSPETVADIFLYQPTPQRRREFEEYRVEWERVNGPTDLTRFYTCMWPKEQQELLWKIDPKAYFNGLPPFLKDYIRGKLRLVAADGRLDDKPDIYVRMFLSGELGRDTDPHRGR